jgi:hypothetical protein
METITVTPAEIIYHRRLAVLDHAARCGNVSETCRTFGVSRTRYYEWKNTADRYGLDALMPKARRKPLMANATPTHVIEQLLTLAVLEPTLGARRLADRLADAGWPIAASTAQKHLAAAGMATRKQRLARAATIAAATTGIVADAARHAEPFGFCHSAPGPGELVALDSFYIGNLKGVGKCYQLTAVDTYTRWATVMIILGTPSGDATARFVAHLVAHWRRHGYQIRAVLTDIQRARIHRRRLPLCAGGQGYPPPAYPAPLPEPQRGRRTLPRHRVTRMLATRVPPQTLHQPPTTPSRRGRLAHHLQPSPPKPRRLHARPHTPPSPHYPHQKPGSMKPHHRTHLQPQPSARKT